MCLRDICTDSILGLKNRTRCCTSAVWNRYIKTLLFTYNCRMLVTNTAFFSWISVLFTNKIPIHVRNLVFILTDILIQTKKGREWEETNCKGLYKEQASSPFKAFWIKVKRTDLWIFVRHFESCQIGQILFRFAHVYTCYPDIV